MVGSFVRFFFTRCEESLNSLVRCAHSFVRASRNSWRKIVRTHQPWSNLYFSGSLILVYTNGIEINLLRVDIILNTNVEKLGIRGRQQRTSPVVRGDISCMRNWRHPGLLPKQYVALCVLNAIVSTLLPNIFVLIGLAAWWKRWYFVVLWCLLSLAIVLSKSSTSSQKSAAYLKKRTILVQTPLRRPTWSQHGRRWRWFVWPVRVYMQPWRCNAEVDFSSK